MRASVLGMLVILTALATPTAAHSAEPARLFGNFSARLEMKRFIKNNPQARRAYEEMKRKPLKDFAPQLGAEVLAGGFMGFGLSLTPTVLVGGYSRSPTAGLATLLGGTVLGASTFYLRALVTRSRQALAAGVLTGLQSEHGSTPNAETRRRWAKALGGVELAHPVFERLAR